MIDVIEILRLVYRNMIEKKGRVFLTVSGILIGIFTFTFFIFVSAGLSNAISEQFLSFGVYVLGVVPVDAPQGGPPTGEGLTDTDLSKIKQVLSNYKYIAPGITFNGQYEFNREKQILYSLSYPDENWVDLRRDLGFEVAEGRFLRPGDSGSIVIGYKLATEKFEDDILVGNVLKLDNRNYRVIGILKERGDLFVDNALLIPFADAKRESGQDTYSVIRISYYENADLEQQKNAILRKLNPNNKEKRVDVTSPSEQVDMFESIIGVLQMIIGFVSSIALVVGGINVMNTMYSNILERINEISVMKALGATNPDIRNLFLVESSLLGLFGAFIGFMLSFGLAKILSYLITNYAGYNVPVHFDWMFFIIVMLLTTFFAMLFGTYPALRAARVIPADNLRDE